MKKLLTILAASTATLFAFGSAPFTPPINVADFQANAFVPGEAFSTALTDAGEETGSIYWYTEDNDASNVISNYLSSDSE